MVRLAPARRGSSGAGATSSCRPRRRALPDSAWRATRVFWLSLTAVASERLPAWKRPRMNASLARAYNQLARHEMHAAGIGVTDAFESTFGQTALTADGVHFPTLSPRHLQALLTAACPRRDRDEFRRRG